MALPRPLLIGDRWQSTATVARILNPFSGTCVADVCLAGPEEADQAVTAAETAFRSLRHLPAHSRGDALAKIADLLATRREEFARTITAESGKPITDARREVNRAIETFTVAAEEARRLGGEVIPMDRAPGVDHHVGMTRRYPVGPVLGITPFNFPLNLVAHKVAPALAAGNPIVLKPAPQTPLTALLLGEVVLMSGLPAGAFSVLPCDNHVAEQMVTDSRFKLLSFTGSAVVGWMLKSKAGKKRVLLELGGNAGVVVEPDADLEYAASRCAVGGFTYSGQTCISVQRIYVHERVYEPFLDMLVKNVGGLKTGDPSDQTTVVGPLINVAAAERVEGWINEAVAQGARIATGGKRVGSFIDPTVLTNVTAPMKIACQEAFGPVVVVTSYRRFEDALAALNDSEYGLQAGIFTKDVDRIFEAFGELEVGAVLANQIPTWRADHMPYGGVKDSGLGREGVRYAIEEMTELKLLVFNARSTRDT